MKFLKMLLLLFLSLIVGYDEPANEEGQENQEDVDLKKSLDENLKNLGDLKKSKKSEMKEYLKDKKNRDKIKEMMKDYKDEDEGEEGDEDEDDKKIKKSFEDAINENEEVIDAVPVLKSFVEVCESLIKSYSELKTEIKDLKSSHDEMIEMQKSFADVVESEVNLVKSNTEDVEKISKIPAPVKGVVSQKDILNKSFGEGGQTEPERISIPILRQALLKSAQDGEISAGIVGKWEMSGYRQDLIPQDAMAIISKHLPKKEGN